MNATFLVADVRVQADDHLGLVGRIRSAGCAALVCLFVGSENVTEEGCRC